jgi:hypothetical protein
LSATLSRREQLRDMLVSELTQITKANGYRNDVQLVSRAVIFEDQVSNYPTLFVNFEKETFGPLDTARTVCNSTVKIAVVGYFGGELESAGVEIVPGDSIGESLAHDMKRCVAGFMTKYINDPQNRWHVGLKDWECDGPILWKHKRHGEVVINLLIQIQAQDKDF